MRRLSTSSTLRAISCRANQIRVDDESGALLDQFGVASGLQSIAKLGRAAIPPNNRVVDRLTRLAIPQHGCFALIRDTDGGNVAAVNPAFVSVARAVSSCVCQIWFASCSTQPACGKICWNSCCATARMEPP